MDINSLLTPLVTFFSDGIGKIIADFLHTIYSVLYPANAGAAQPVEIPQ